MKYYLLEIHLKVDHIKMLFFDIVFFGIASKNQCQSTIAGYIAGCSEAVLKSKDGTSLSPRLKVPPGL